MKGLDVGCCLDEIGSDVPVTLPAALWGHAEVMRWTSLLMLLSMLCWKALPDSTACHSWRLVFASLPVLYLQHTYPETQLSQAAAILCSNNEEGTAARLVSILPTQEAWR